MSVRRCGPAHGFAATIHVSLAALYSMAINAIRPDRTVVNGLCGNIVGVSENLVLIMGEGARAEVDLQEAQFAFVTERDLPAEVREELRSDFDSGIFISQTDGSMFAFFEVLDE